MKVSGFWSLTGLVVTGLIIADLVLHPSGTSTAFKGVTGLTTATGNQLIGTAAK
jgi:hypothetical protein